MPEIRMTENLSKEVMNVNIDNFVMIKFNINIHVDPTPKIMMVI